MTNIKKNHCFNYITWTNDNYNDDNNNDVNNNNNFNVVFITLKSWRFLRFLRLIVLYIYSGVVKSVIGTSFLEDRRKKRYVDDSMNILQIDR